MTTISTPSGVFTPELVEQIVTAQDSGNLIHRTLSGGVDVTLRPAGLRTGELRMLFTSLAVADSCRVAHAAAAVFALADATVPSFQMAYVVDGSIGLEADNETAWWVSVGFQEVTP